MDESPWGYAGRVISGSWAPAIAIFGTMVAALGAFYGSAGVALAGAIISGAASFIGAFRQANFEEQLRAANAKLLHQAEDIAARVTGGDSYAYVQVQHIVANLFPDLPNKSATILLLVVHQGKYPLYDMNVRIWCDADAARSGDAFYLGVTVSIGTVAPDSSMWLPPVEIDPAHGTRNMNLFFSARNGFWTQEILGRLVGGEWAYAWRVSRARSGGGNEYLGESVPPGFPRAPGGEVGWTGG